jgi:RHS repeat-associated protein
MRIRHHNSARGDIDYFYDDKAVLEERDSGSSALVAHYRYADRLLSLSTGSDTQYYHHDALGSTTHLSKTDGTTQVSYRLDPWGHVTEQVGSSVNRQVFTGQEHDENTDLIYFGARYYDPDSARFLNQDSYLGEANTPPSLHRYLYAYANPLVYIDLYGYDNTQAQPDTSTSRRYRRRSSSSTNNQRRARRVARQAATKVGSRLAPSATGVGVGVTISLLANDYVDLVSGQIQSIRDHLEEKQLQNNHDAYNQKIDRMFDKVERCNCTTPEYADYLQSDIGRQLEELRTRKYLIDKGIIPAVSQDSGRGLSVSSDELGSESGDAQMTTGSSDGSAEVEHAKVPNKLATESAPIEVNPLNPNTRFYVSPEGDVLDAKTYARNSGFRNGVRDEVWADAVDSETGLVRDPLSGAEMNQEEAWDMGHRPGMEYWKERDNAINRWLDEREHTSRQEFLDKMNDPKRYRPELPSSNRSHRDEDASNDFWE